jgi:hypothetical protein
MRMDSGDTPHLVVLEPGSDRGRRIPLDRDYLVVGREPACDVRFDNPHVSRTHAALRRRGNAVYVEDLGSFGGTFVNGATAATACELHVGDLLTFASVTARLESGATSGDETITMQRAAVINHAERRYNSHVQYASQQRENVLRKAAATKTKARWLAWTGLLMVVVGFGVFATASRFGLEVGGIPVGTACWALAALGALLLIAGIMLHVIATSRRKQAYRDFPVLPAGSTAQARQPASRPRH